MGTPYPATCWLPMRLSTPDFNDHIENIYIYRTLYNISRCILINSLLPHEMTYYTSIKIFKETEKINNLGFLLRLRYCLFPLRRDQRKPRVETGGVASVFSSAQMLST